MFLARARFVLRAVTACVLAAALLPFVPVAAAAAETVAPVIGATVKLQPPQPLVAALDGRPQPVVVSAKSSIAFSMVGFTIPRGHELRFRTSVDGTTWGPWRTPEEEADSDDTPDAGSAEMRRARRVAPATVRTTEPLWVGEARWLQTKVTGPRASTVVPVAHVVDSTGLQRNLVQRVADRVVAAWHGTTITAPATAAASRPRIISRSQWGANESWRDAPRYMPKLKAAVIHHTAGSNAYGRNEAAAVVRGVYWYHTHARGWSDLGYNFLVDRFGRIYEGRAGGARRNVMGAHAGGFNTATFGVSLMGEFSSQRPPAVMRRAAARLIAWKFRLKQIKPRGSVTLTSAGSTKYPTGRQVRLRTISGHRDVSATACPGGKAYSLLRTLRRRVARVLGSGGTPPPTDDGRDEQPDPDRPDPPDPDGPDEPRRPNRILVSASDDRDDARRLDGRTVRGWMFVWSNRRSSDTNQVEFSIRPDDAVEDSHHTEYYEPYDFGWINTHALRDGSHTIVAKVTHADSRVTQHSATFFVDNHAPGRPWAWRVNAGGPRIVDGRRVWQQDTGYDGGDIASNDSQTVAGAALPVLHSDERYRMDGYHVRVPRDGAYRVRLHLAEIYFYEPGRRIFSAWAEGARMLDDYDMVAAIGPWRAKVVETSVTVTDGVLDLGFWARENHAKVDAFEVIMGGSGIPGPAVTTPEPPAPPLQLQVSTNRWRGSEEPLEGATLTGPVYVFLDGAEEAESVAFHVDDPQAQDSPYHTEGYVPWDMGGTRDGNTAGSWDPRGLGHGDHTVTAAVHTDGQTRLVTATFHVDP